MCRTPNDSTRQCCIEEIHGKSFVLQIHTNVSTQRTNQSDTNHKCLSRKCCADCRISNGISLQFLSVFLQAPKLLPETISEQATALQEMLPIRARWEPVDKILELNGIQLLLRIIASSYEWIYSGR